MRTVRETNQSKRDLLLKRRNNPQDLKGAFIFRRLSNLPKPKTTKNKYSIIKTTNTKKQKTGEIL